MRVAIIHPWFPEYRAPFFAELLRIAHMQNIEIDIFYGQTPPEWAARSDATSSTYAVQLPTKFFSLRGKTLINKSLALVHDRGPYDLVIVEHAVRNLETYRLLWGLRKQPVAFWGHGRTYSSEFSPVQEAFKRWLSLRGVWFFAYTNGGAAAVVASGFNPARVTALQNAVSSNPFSEVQPGEFALPDQVSGRGNRKFALYMGGLDGPKRIGFLLAAARLAHARDSEFQLVIAGDGVGRAEVEEAAENCNWITYVGRVVGQEKAFLLSQADVLAIPGSVGLVAVDSFASATPIITTVWPLHGPEFEYLIDGVNAAVSEDSLGAYSNLLVDVLGDQPWLETLRAGCLEAAQIYTVENMASRFMEGLNGALITRAGRQDRFPRFPRWPRVESHSL